jgi:hypothetical protein
MQGGDLGNGAGQPTHRQPRVATLLVVVGVTLLVGGACVGLVWSTLNALGTGPVEDERLALAGLSIVVLLLLVGWCYRTLAALAPATPSDPPARQAATEAARPGRANTDEGGPT